MVTLRRYYDGQDVLSATLLEIREVDGRLAAVTDLTNFYPEGGGQSSDHGTIEAAAGPCIAVTDVQASGDEILHFFDSAVATALKPGPVVLRRDALRRRDSAVQHSAQHLLSATLLRLYGAPTVSMHLGEGTNTIDVEDPNLAEADLTTAEEAVQDIIEEDYPIIIHYCPPEDIDAFPLRKKPPAGEEVIRVVELDGYDYSPCCGIHLASTGPIGMVKILGAEKYKGMTRISFIAGRRVLRSFRVLRAAAEAASRTLKVPLEELGRGTAAAAERSAALDRTVLTLREQLASMEAERLAAAAPAGAAVLVASYNDRGMDEALRVGRALQKLSSAVVLVASSPERKAAALCSRRDLDLRPAMRELFAAHRGTGGGGPSFYQGAFSSHADLQAFLAAARGVF